MDADEEPADDQQAQIAALAARVRGMENAYASLAQEAEAAAAAAYEQGLREGAAAARRELLDQRAASYNDGLASGNLCGAQEEGVTIGGVPVLCMRPAGHAMGPLDRHKAVFGEPHVAVSWNDRADEYRSAMADPDSYQTEAAR